MGVTRLPCSHPLRRPSRCQTNGVRISPGAPSREQADQPPNGLGASFWPGCVGLQPLENGAKTRNLMPFGLQPEGRHLLKRLDATPSEGGRHARHGARDPLKNHVPQCPSWIYASRSASSRRNGPVTWNCTITPSAQIATRQAFSDLRTTTE